MAYRATLAENHELLECFEDVCARLMDRHDDGSVLALCVRLEEATDAQGVEAVESARRLIQKDDRRSRDKLTGNLDAPLLAARDPAVAALAVAPIHDVLDAEFLGERLDPLDELIICHDFGETEARRGEKNLADRLRSEDGGLLVDVDRDALEGAADGNAVEEHLARRLASLGATGEDVEQGRLAGTARADDRQDLARVRNAVDPKEHLLAL